MYKFTIKIPIYDCSCHIIISEDIEKVVNSYVKRKKWDKDMEIKQGNELHGLAISGNIKDYYIFYSINSLMVTYITHEISHTVDYIIDEKGIEDKGEARAYLTGYISEKIFDYILKKKLLLNKWFKVKEDEKPSAISGEDNKIIKDS